MHHIRKSVVFALFAYRVDGGVSEERWLRWRPLLALCGLKAFPMDTLYLLYPQAHKDAVALLESDIQHSAPHINVIAQTSERLPETFHDFYLEFYQYFKEFHFDNKLCKYYLYFPPGVFPHVSLALIDIIRTFRLPLEIVQVYQNPVDGVLQTEYAVFNTDVSKTLREHDVYRQHMLNDQDYLKSGIATRNTAFNDLIARLEHVALNSQAPMLISGPTGAGKSHLVRRVYDLKLRHGQVAGPLVEVNCSALHGDMAAAALFGHVKGAFTGADSKRTGLLLKAHKGLLFLDEIGELGLGEQALLLKAVEEHRFLPVGSDVEVESHFQLVCGTNRNLEEETQARRFRQDLLTRINIWQFRLPALKDRVEDIAPNIHYELERLSPIFHKTLSFTEDAYARFLHFAVSAQALWPGNFRELAAVMERMATFNRNGDIGLEVVEAEIRQLLEGWAMAGTKGQSSAYSQEQFTTTKAQEGLACMSQRGTDCIPALEQVIGVEACAQLDLFERIHLAGTIAVCRQSTSMSEAGRRLFAVSRQNKKYVDDANRLHNYLKKYGLNWRDVR